MVQIIRAITVYRKISTQSPHPQAPPPDYSHTLLYTSKHSEWLAPRFIYPVWNVTKAGNKVTFALCQTNDNTVPNCKASCLMVASRYDYMIRLVECDWLIHHVIRFAYQLLVALHSKQLK